MPPDVAPKCPPITSALIAYLEHVFPDTSADLGWTDREVWHKAGRAHVVRHLRFLLEEQQENILSPQR
jgi:hypothetical protein